MTRRPATACSYVRRDGRFCGTPAAVVIDYGSGVGACPTHIWQRVSFAQEGNGRDQGERPVTVWPAWLWLREHPRTGDAAVPD